MISPELFFQSVEKTASDKLHRPLTAVESEAIRSSGSTMMLESVYMQFYYAKTTEKAEELMKDVVKAFTRKQ